MNLVDASTLPGTDAVRRFEGADHGSSGVSFFIIEGGVIGGGPVLHRHPYDETWLIQRGRLALHIGDEDREAGTGEIAIVPAGTPHKFTHLGPEPSKVLCIHASPRMIQEDLE
jgi:mannose-6-phosphate isomerase-like protein (cupin superfamily)